MTIDFIINKDATEKIIHQICLLKKQHWDYSMDDQKKWIKSNLAPNDVHLLCMGGGDIIAYLNLVRLNVVSNGTATVMIGIGNVCVDKSQQKNHYGFFVMKTAEYFLRKNKMNGILLCKDRLAPFYDTIRWSRYNGITEIQDHEFNDNVYVYVYNSLVSKKIIIDKNF